MCSGPLLPARVAKYVLHRMHRGRVLHRRLRGRGAVHRGSWERVPERGESRSGLDLQCGVQLRRRRRCSDALHDRRVRERASAAGLLLVIG